MSSSSYKLASTPVRIILIKYANLLKARNNPLLKAELNKKGAYYRYYKFSYITLDKAYIFYEDYSPFKFGDVSRETPINAVTINAIDTNYYNDYDYFALLATKTPLTIEATL